MATDAFREAIDPETLPERREQIRQEVFSYCCLDTLAMIGLWKFFLGLKGPELVDPKIGE